MSRLNIEFYGSAGKAPNVDMSSLIAVGVMGGHYSEAAYPVIIDEEAVKHEPAVTFSMGHAMEHFGLK